MDANTLIKYLQSLGYQGDDAGVCYGVTHTAMDYFFTDAVEEFNEQIHFLSGIPIHELQKEITEARKRNRSTASSNSYTKTNGNKNETGHSKLTRDQLLLRTNPFFEAIELYQQAYEYPYLFAEGEALTGQNAQKTLSLIQSKEIEESGGLTAMKPFSGIYDPQELSIYFESLENCLKDFDDKVFLSLSNADHSIGVGYNPLKKQWFFIDANSLPIQETSDFNTIVEAVNVAFFADQITAFSSTIYSKNKKIKELEERINTWKNIIKEIHIPDIAKANMITSHGDTWLSLAVENEEIDIVKGLVSIRGIDINFLDSSNQSVLFSRLRNKDIVEELLKYGADTNIQDNNKKTVLFYSLNYIKTLKILLEHGADPNISDDQKRTPLFFALLIPKPLESVKLLLNNDANPNYKDENGNTPLLISVYEDPNTTRLLLEYGADPYVKNNDGVCFLQEVIAKQNLPVIEMLSESTFPANLKEKDKAFFINFKKFINQELKTDDILSLFENAVEFDKRNQTSTVNDLIKTLFKSKYYKDIIVKLWEHDKNNLKLIHFLIESIDTKLVPNNEMLKLLKMVVGTLGLKNRTVEDKEIYCLIKELHKKNPAYTELSEKASNLAAEDEKSNSLTKENLSAFLKNSNIENNDEPQTISNQQTSKNMRST